MLLGAEFAKAVGTLAVKAQRNLLTADDSWRFIEFMDGFQLFQWGKFRSRLVNVLKAQSSHLHLHEALLVSVAFPGVLLRQCRSVS